MIKKATTSSDLDRSAYSSSLQSQESRLRNDRQTIFALTKELVHAQFELADQELTKRLWQEVADRNLSIDRIINLMYASSSYDDETMLMVDSAYQGL